MVDQLVVSAPVGGCHRLFVARGGLGWGISAARQVSPAIMAARRQDLRRIFPAAKRRAAVAAKAKAAAGAQAQAAPAKKRYRQKERKATRPVHATYFMS